MKLKEIVHIFNGETLYAIAIQGIGGHFSPVYSEKIPKTFLDYEILQCSVSGEVKMKWSEKIGEYIAEQNVCVIVELKNPTYSSEPEQR